MTSALQCVPNLSDERVVSAPARNLPTEFNENCAAAKLYLLIGDEKGNAKSFHQMEQRSRDQWSLVLSLKPGSYRYRCYAEQAAVTTYMRPNEVRDAPLQMDGFDAVLIVPQAAPPGSASFMS
jgi:hypothetical protein